MQGAMHTDKRAEQAILVALALVMAICLMPALALAQSAGGGPFSTGATGMLRAIDPRKRPISARFCRLRECGANGLRGLGAKPDGRELRVCDQAAWNRSTRNAGDRGGARAGRCRWVRIFVISAGATIAAMIFRRPPQFGQCSTSISNTRLSRHAQLMRAGAKAGGLWA